MTPLQEVFNAFLAKIESDDWDGWTYEEAEIDFIEILKSAVTMFKFPRKSLAFDEEYFESELDNEEIQILACYMKCEWLERTILSYENIKVMYVERDFSPANLLDKLETLLAHEQKEAHKRESNYYRSINYKPYPYRNLGSQDV